MIFTIYNIKCNEINIINNFRLPILKMLNDFNKVLSYHSKACFCQNSGGSLGQIILFSTLRITVSVLNYRCVSKKDMLAFTITFEMIILLGGLHENPYMFLV